MRKRLFILSALLVPGLVFQVRAEQSPQTATGSRYQDNQVFTIAYNNSGSTIQSNSVVILDTSGTAGTTLGAYITTTTSAGSQYILGVTDETITAGATGRICIRGPHKLHFTSAPTAGDTASTGTTAGRATTQTSTANQYGYIGIVLGGTAATDIDRSPLIWWVFVRPTAQ